ncbi:MAG TPA: histidinol dehydrogenase [Bacteroidia bacterium]|jgi:histidinol dehydrogenase
MKTIKYPDKADWPELLKRPVMDTAALEKSVGGVLKDVRKNGDKALLNFALQFDKVKLESLEVSRKELESAEVSAELEAAMKTAYENIYNFHWSQKEGAKEMETVEGVRCWRKSVGIEKVGLYIPGGSAPLFSTVLMLAIPAKIAGCREVILCTPPGKDGKVNEAILFAANLCGIRKVFKAGGAQAIAALAYGTECIPKVSKIFGPGNQYVTCAKQLVQKEGVAIDMPAGPSEVAVLADESAVPAFVASDLLSQAEHGADSQVLLVSDSEKLIDEVIKEVKNQMSVLPRKDIVLKALENSKAVLVKDMNEGMELLNEYAPEHLIINCKESDAMAGQVVNAGSVFLGNYTPESAGDYASGTNHTLPTNGYAKAYSGVSLDSFVKKITFQEITKEGIKRLGPSIETMAKAEGLNAHSNAVTIRIRKNV